MWLNKVGVFAVVVLFGCSVPTKRIFQVPTTLREQANPAGASARPGDSAAERIHALRQEILQLDELSPGGGAARPGERLTYSPTIQALLRSAVVLQALDSAESAALGAPPTDSKLDRADAQSFAEQLADGRDAIFDELVSSRAARESSPNASFDKRFNAYLEAWLDGGFVSRFGSSLDAPDIVDGADNAEISGLVTVFFEALFDQAYADMPVFYDGEQEKFEMSWVPVVGGDPNEYRQKYTKLPATTLKYMTNGDFDAPTVAAVGMAKLSDVSKGGEITADEVKHIRFVGRLAGKQSSALTGLLIESLSSVDIGIAVAVDFAIGDNDTLGEMIKTAGEVTSRRTAEYLAYRNALN